MNWCSNVFLSLRETAAFPYTKPLTWFGGYGSITTSNPHPFTELNRLCDKNDNLESIQYSYQQQGIVKDLDSTALLKSWVNKLLAL